MILVKNVNPFLDNQIHKNKNITHEKLIQIFPLFVMFHDIEQNHNNFYKDRDENNLFTKEV